MSAPYIGGSLNVIIIRDKTKRSSANISLGEQHLFYKIISVHYICMGFILDKLNWLTQIFLWLILEQSPKVLVW